MLPAAHLIARSVPGYGLSDSRWPAVSGGGFKASLCSSRNNYIGFPHVKVLPLGCASWGSVSSICSVNSSGQRRNPDFSRKNRHGFSRNKNRRNEGRDSIDSLEDTDMFFSKSGTPLLSGSDSLKFQATATPGPREREIVELFRRVQVQLRERAAVKEEKKVEESREPNKQSQSVDSLLGLLRKHSVQHGTSSSSNNNGRNTNSFDPNSNAKHEVQDCKVPSVSRPVSNFQRRSPVPQFKYQLILSGKDTDSEPFTDEKKKEIKSNSKPEPKLEFKVETDAKPQVETKEFHANGGAFYGVSDTEIQASDIEYSADEIEITEEEKMNECSDLSRMKLSELRAVAKSRGLKGLSKRKKRELLEVLASSCAA